MFSISNQGEFGKSIKLSKNILLLIDEGELYLHPTWQKQLLFQLITVIPYIFKNNSLDGNPNAVQIILTSNSPLIISDIPSSNIVFLKKKYLDNGKNEIVNDNLEDNKLTFAANIHSLLADSFFMENGLIGDFAFHKINEVISILQGNRLKIEEHKEKIIKIILMIGESVIREKLIQMLNERLSLDMVDLNERITALENELQKFKKNN